MDIYLTKDIKAKPFILRETLQGLKNMIFSMILLRMENKNSFVFLC